MHDFFSRRSFLEASAFSAAAVAATGLLNARDSQAGQSAKQESKPEATGAANGGQVPLTVKKAVKIGMVQLPGTLTDKFKGLKELGYDGVELDSPSPLKLEEVLEARDKSGLTIHGVVDSVHWKQTLSHPEEAVRAQGVTALEQAIRDSKAYGGTSVLLVPAVVNREVSYADAYKRSQAEIKKAIPLAGELGIRILFENVWNNFLLSPLEMARYIDEFDSPVVGAYFDVGNIVHYGWPQHWVEALGKRIGKLDIKGFSRGIADKEGKYKGFNAEIGEDDCDWSAVSKALTEAGFTEIWGTAEVRGGNAERLKDILQRMNKAFPKA